jgi:thiol-disulfide isomerase/thioredoxin
LFVALLAATSPLGRAAEAGAAAEVDPQAQKVLDDFGKFYKSTKGFEVTSAVDLVIEQGGQKQSQKFDIDLAAERPNKLAFKLESPQGGATIVSDGSEVAAYVNAFQKYTVEKAPPAWDGLWANPMVQGPMSFGNASVVTMALLSDSPVKKLLEKVSGATYGGIVDLDGQKMHLIKASSEEMDWQLWIDAGEKPLVRQFVPDLGKALERMAKASKQKSPFANLKVSNTVSYKDWKLDPKFDAKTFVFEVPEGAEKAASLQDIIGGGRPQEAPGPHPLVGEVAPPVKLDLLDGGTLDLASYKGKNVVILDFWATWCGPCVRAMPVIDAVAEKFKEKGVLLFAVNLQEEPEDIKKFLEEAEIQLDVALDKTGEAAQAYKAEAIPQTVIIGKDGTVQVVHVGLLPNLEEQLSQDLEALVAGKNLAAESLAKEKKKTPAAAEEAKPPAAAPAEPKAKGGKLKIELKK